MKILLIFLLSCLCTLLDAASFTNNGSGQFSVGTTWIGGAAPAAAGDVFVITNGIVTYDTNNSGTTGWGASQIQLGGELRMTNKTTCYFKMNGNLSGLGLWTIGNSSNSMTFSVTNTPGCVVQFLTPAQCTMTGTNNIRIWGDYSHQTNGTLTATALSGTNQIVVSGVPVNVVSNDVITVGNKNNAAQVSYAFVIASVSGNVITLKTLAQLGFETNCYNYTVFYGVTPLILTNGSAFTILSQPVIFYDTSQRNTSIFTASQTNTIAGVLCNGLGNGLCTSCNGWTVSNSTANGNSSGGFANSCNGWTVSNSTANGNTYGGFAVSCNGWTVSNSTANGNTSGGFAHSCNGWTVSNSTANGNASGGFANSCNGWTVSNSTANGNTSGGFAFNCNGWTVSNSTANGNASGGFANGCDGWTVSNSTANGNNYGGFANSCDGWTVSNCTNSDSETLYNTCFQIQTINTKTAGDTFAAYIIDWQPIYVADTYWIYCGGFATNKGGVLNFTNSLANANIAAEETISLRPNSTRTVFVSMFQTNNVTYQVSYAFGSQPLNWNFVSTPNNSLLWTNTYVTLANTNNYSIFATLWINAVAPTLTTGYAQYSVGQDAVILSQ